MGKFIPPRRVQRQEARAAMIERAKADAAAEEPAAEPPAPAPKPAPAKTRERKPRKEAAQ